MASAFPDIDSGSDQVQKCDICTENFTDGYCCDCEAHMCQTCFDRHLKTKLCKQHVLSAEPNREKVDEKSYTEPCKIHENQTIKFFCVDHSMVGCAECMLADHSICKRENINVAAKKFQENEASPLSTAVQELLSQHDGCMEQIQLLTESVVASNDQTVNDIETFDVTINAIVKETIRVAFERAKHLRIKNERAVEKLSCQLNKIKCALTSFKDDLENEDTPEKLLINAMEMKSLMEMYRATASKLNRSDTITTFKFQPNEQTNDIITGSKSLGEVLEESYTPANTVEHSKEKEQADESNPTNQKHPQPKQATKEEERKQTKPLPWLSHLDTSDVGMSFMTSDGIKIRVYNAGILSLDVDCIASASNSDLINGGGVARVIAKAAGPSLEAGCKSYIRANKKLPIGQACSTTAGNLHYKCVIHAVGPQWWQYNRKPNGQQQCEDALMNTVLSALYEAERNGCKTIALPAISSAIFGVPLDICSRQYVRSVWNYSLQKKDNQPAMLSEIHFIDVREDTVSTIQQAFKMFCGRQTSD